MVFKLESLLVHAVPAQSKQQTLFDGDDTVGVDVRENKLKRSWFSVRQQDNRKICVSVGPGTASIV